MRALHTYAILSMIQIIAMIIDKNIFWLGDKLFVQLLVQDNFLEQ